MIKDDNSKPKVILLVALVVLVAVFGVFRVVKSTKTQAAPVVEKDSVKETAPVVDEFDPSKIMVSGKPLTMALAPQAARDPFTPQVAPKEIKNNSEPVRKSDMTPMVNRINDLPFPLIPFGGSNDTVEPVQPAPEQNPTEGLKLVGIIDGTKKLAILRGPQGERYFVREGDSVDGEFRVESITRMYVRVRSGDRVFFLRLGGNDGTQDRV